MARARSIKPGLLKNEVLGVADPLYTLLFEGLWMLADRAGRLEDRPLRIKAEVFPYRDGIDCNAMLEWLQTSSFIVRYEVNGVRYIQILNFEKHQNPHKHEPASEIPAIPDATTDIGCSPTANVRSRPADSGLLTPSSLTPDSIEVPTVLGDEAAPPRHPCPTDRIIALYHQHLPMLSRVEVINDARRRSISARWKEVISDPDIRKAQDPREAALEFFAWFFGHVATSAFLTGKSKDWRADIDFLMTPTKFARVVEGNYHKEHA